MTDSFLLLLIFVCLAGWPLLARRAKKSHRFEFFTVDFAVGAFLAGLLLALALGNTGLLLEQSELSLNDRLLIASKTAQALTLFAGVVLGLGFLALFGAAKLLGMGPGLLLALTGAGVLDGALAATRACSIPLAAGLLATLAAFWLAYRTVRARDPLAPSAKLARPGLPTRRPVRKSTKGLALAGFAAVLFGLALPLAVSGLNGEIGTGPFVGILLLGPGMLPAAAVFALILVNINIDLPAGSFRPYFSGKLASHFLAWTAGAAWCAGIFSLLLAASRAARAGLPSTLHWPQDLAILGLATAAIVSFASESHPTKRPAAVWSALLCFTVGLLLISQNF